MIFPKDFSARKTFPGVSGNPFDVFLHQLQKIEEIPTLFFTLFLFVVALLPVWNNWKLSLILWVFFLTDWLLLSLLPKFGLSYGPSKPSVLFMAFTRVVVSFLPLFYGLILQIICTFLVIYGFYYEPFQLKINIIKVKTRKLPQTSAIRILHLGDLHVERFTRREQLVINYINDLKPDLILFSGDILNLSYLDDKQSWIDARFILNQWKAPLGVFVVKGSPAVDLDTIFPKLIDDLPLRWLQDEKVSIIYQGSQIDLFGLSCSHQPHIDAIKLESLMDKSTDNYNILLYHSPDLAPIAANLGIDLQLSGHTHGGQVCLPVFGALITGSLYGKKFESGQKIINKMILFITRGIGLEGSSAPRVRFLCPPEIVLIELSSEV